MERDATYDVGQRLKALREERGISMRELARRSSLSANALSMIERGLTSPSVSTLSKLATAMGVPITVFFRHEPERSPVVLTQKKDRIRVEISKGFWESLGGDEFLGKLFAMEFTLEPGATSGPHIWVHTGNEFLYCLEGILDYEIDGSMQHLKPGDSVIFTPELPHRWANTSMAPCRALLVIANFNSGDRPPAFHHL